MRNLLLVFCCFLTTISVTAQQNVYMNVRNKVVEDLQDRDFAAAYTRIKLLAALLSETNENDYHALKEQLQDSLDNSYHRANSLIEKEKYELAIVEYQRLIGSNKNPLKSPLYAYIGYCYEMSGANLLAKSNYELGIQHNEPLSALRMAWYIRKNRIPATTQEMINLYEQASIYYAARDSLGVEYARLGNFLDSYKWFRKSQGNFSKYNRASYLLDGTIFSQLSEEYKTDDPIKLLTEAANDGYAPAQYDLGLLYYFAKEGDKVKKDQLKGKSLMEMAAKQKYAQAINMLSDLDEPVHPPTCKEKFEYFCWDIIDFFTPAEDLLGVTYEYNDVFPLGLSASRSWYLFKLGLDLGFNFTYKRYNEKLDPLAYVTLSPGLYLQYISIDLGIGALYSYAVEIKKWSDTSSEDFGFTSEDGSISGSGSITTSTSGSLTTVYPEFNFLLKPSATVYIPLNSWDEYFITLSAGYNYFYNFEELNGWSFGIGFHWAI